MRPPRVTSAERMAHCDTWREGVEYGLCYCGCGTETPLATKTSRGLGKYKGLPTRWMAGHRKCIPPRDRVDAATERAREEWRKNWPQDKPYGFCICGCGQRTNPAKRTHRIKSHGLVSARGEPALRLKGHRCTTAGRVRVKVQLGGFWPSGIPHGCCRCGCGAWVGFQGRASSQKGRKIGDPIGYAAGHNILAAFPKDTDGERHCPGCKRWLPLGTFRANLRGPGGRGRRCKHCQAAWEHRRRVKMRGLPPGATPEQVRLMIESNGGLCAYCGEEATTIDHIVAIMRGGTNDISNLTTACKSCNSSKGVRELWVEWIPPISRPEECCA